MALLGVSPKQLQHNPTTVLPSINSFQANGAGLGNHQNDQVGNDKDEDDNDAVISEAQELEDLVRRVEKSEKTGFRWLAEAAALVTADEFMRMYVSRI